MGVKTTENTAGAQELIRDTDMAKKLIGLIKASILTEEGMPIPAQANVSAEGVILMLRKS